MMNGESQIAATPSDEGRHSSFIIPHSSFGLLLDPPADGAWNMAVDETLLEAAADEGRCTLRFYQWAEPTLSLGYFQAYSARAGHEASRRSAAVRRTSGGGAILHDFDVTYSLAVPDGHPLAANRLRTYRVVHDALIEVLADAGIEASLFSPGTPGLGRGNHSPAPRWGGSCTAAPSPAAAEGGQCNCPPNAIGDCRHSEPFLCFQRRAAGDVLVKGEKIAGSAQRRRRGAVLQHGSVLLARSPAAPELDGLKELAAETILVEEFIEAWLEKLAAALVVQWRRGSLGDADRRRATELATEKYASPAWTKAR
ncbi:MAG: biotin/lipoate A/B protein ligase family protein [Thermoguttaceae bacterium]|jgi:lipoate-protein ligase A